MDVQLDHDTANRLAELAQAAHRSQAELAAQLLKAYLSDLQTWQLEAIKQGLSEADAGKLDEIEQIRQRWEQKRARQADTQR
jgi:predicted transcriptional regulator